MGRRILNAAEGILAFGFVTVAMLGSHLRSRRAAR